MRFSYRRAPHTRGWTVAQVSDSHDFVLSPAHAGMDLPVQEARRTILRQQFRWHRRCSICGAGIRDLPENIERSSHLKYGHMAGKRSGKIEVGATWRFDGQ
ncbi:hypothetical protein B005_4894 [Nocardiopsis alba ATCC BAA-2165]|uniref:Uncharacterized protein n=1 Tax=Nocardiopsis alba (strain ATCC BAA-2165 / BE74) TaxID=1205910 RepID=J7LBQ5_NOCAA|nr:hypothetical protein B005_4894 [Nocardiopsis alba ATCC BAA-2165]